MSESTGFDQDRRVQPRREPKEAAQLVCVSQRFGMARNLATDLLDVSTNGARLVVEEPMQAWDDVAIGLEVPLISRLARLPAEEASWSIANAQVIWSVALPNGSHCIGVHFAKMLRDDLFNELTARANVPDDLIDAVKGLTL
jgi:hypothetical protein